MAGTGRHANHRLADWVDAIERNPCEFGFYQALRLVECCYADRSRLGTSPVPAGEPPIRLMQEPAMSFESASLTRYAPGSQGEDARLWIRFFGLLGPNGPLPLHLTEYALARQLHHKDPTFIHFLDIFHHRMLSLFYRARADSEPTFSFDRPRSDRFAGYVGALAGLGMETLRHRDLMPDLTKLYYCGHLACQKKSAHGLQAILSDYFRISVAIREFVSEWVDLPMHLVSRMGDGHTGDRLGKSMIMGTRIWGGHHKFRIVLGPMDRERYQRFLPDSDNIRQLVALVRNYIGDELAWDVQLRLQGEEVPTARLDGEYHLGWSAWMGRRGRDEPAEDFIFDAVALLNKQQKYQDVQRD